MNLKANQVVATLFLFIPIALASGIWAWYGSCLSTWFDTMTNWRMILMAGSGWIIHLILVFVLMNKEIRSDYLGYLFSVVLLSGLLILFLTLIGQSIFPFKIKEIPISILGFSYAVMLYRHIKKTSFIGLSQKWTLYWIIAMLSGFVFWSGYFF